MWANVVVVVGSVVLVEGHKRVSRGEAVRRT